FAQPPQDFSYVHVFQPSLHWFPPGSFFVAREDNSIFPLCKVAHFGRIPVAHFGRISLVHYRAKIDTKTGAPLGAPVLSNETSLAELF
ncbi:MAG: hypothetical protein L6461_22830, partial [Anaerolineae bacterium]|nr:hypothetical protein [Anaerolineae bacterium]